MIKSLALLGFASGIAANNPDCALGPWYLYYHPELFNKLPFAVHWDPIIHTTSNSRGLNVLPLVEENIEKLSQAVLHTINQDVPFCVIGGDHSCAIGTWSAVAHAYRPHGDIGLIWIDAHMDSHTPKTSKSQNIHGMPVAHLLGEGVNRLCQIFDNNPKIKPENLCLIGIRSYEEEEAALLTRLGVRVFFMDEVQQRGIQSVLNDAYHIVSNGTCGIGISIDLDAIDPLDAPGVNCIEPNGINGNALISALKSIDFKNNLLALEIAELNPMLDHNEKTAKLLIDLLDAVCG